MTENIVSRARNHVDLLEANVGLDPVHQALSPYERFNKLREWLGIFAKPDPDVAPQQVALPAIPVETLGGTFGQISLRFRLAYGNDRISPQPAVNTLDTKLPSPPRKPYWRPTAVFAEWLLHPAAADPALITGTPQTRGEILSYGGILKTTGVSLMEVADPSIAGPALPGTEAKLFLLEGLHDYYEQPLQRQTSGGANHFQPEG